MLSFPDKPEGSLPGAECSRNDQFACVAGIVYGFGDFREPCPAWTAPFWESRPRKRQVHGSRIAEVSVPDEWVGDADGLLTWTPGLLLSIPTADCLPILLAREDGQAIAALHLGWRGTMAGIVEEFGRLLQHHGERAARWKAVLGPCAQACCYEVSDDLLTEFSFRFRIPRTRLSPIPRHLSLAAIAQHLLQGIGIDAISDEGACTICSQQAGQGQSAEPRFHSYRRDQLHRDPGRDQQYAVILRTD